MEGCPSITPVSEMHNAQMRTSRRIAVTRARSRLVSTQSDLIIKDINSFRILTDAEMAAVVDDMDTLC